MNINIRETDRDMAEINLDEAQVGQRTRKCGSKNWFDRVFDDVGTSYTDVGP